MTPLKHRRAAVLLALAVIAAHLLFTDALLTQLAELNPDSHAPERIDVNFVSEVRMSAPPQAAAPPAPPPPRKRPRRARRVVMPPDLPASVAPPEPTASAPDDRASAPDDAASAASAADAAASQAEAPASAASGAQTAASAAAAASGAASAGAAKPFEWPASTRIRFKLTGQYRGEVQGSAQVDWLLDGTHYQVRVETLIGPKFAPVFRRSLSSDGEISAEGLVPHRYDEETKMAFTSPKRKYVLFEGDEVELSDGKKREPRLPGVQDPASLFVQFTYSFTTHPSQLTAGNVLVLPLARPSKQEPITYDVLGTEVLNTPMGALPAVHVKPRIPPRPGKPDLNVELWFAPNLEYLPVRMRVQQDERTYVDMMIDGPPLRGAVKPQAAPVGASAASQPPASAAAAAAEPPAAATSAAP